VTEVVTAFECTGWLGLLVQDSKCLLRILWQAGTYDTKKSAIASIELPAAASAQTKVYDLISTRVVADSWYIE
jgi:hypothetical protein